ncbi:ComEC/Rec2 family competence protein [Arthrobacter sp. 08Y14]|uniref:ComEC/Rec2 family competence protein n=1 Tax=Arthrobacter sp. 08Y14 TaxID=2058885 RepID=UPI000CE4CA46|nr:ComEC/Rec2 family competence protein [Arthrobacter sp. 08Y14]
MMDGKGPADEPKSNDDVVRVQGVDVFHEGRRVRVSGWHRYTAAALRGDVQPPGTDAPEPSGPWPPKAPGVPAVVSRGHFHPGVSRVVQRIRALVPERPADARIHPLLEFRLVPVAAAAWAAAFLAVRLPGHEARVLGAILALISIVLLSLVPALRRTGSRRTSSQESRLSSHSGMFVRAAAVPAAAAALVCVSAGALTAERTAGPIASAISEGRTVTGEFRASTDARAVAADRFSGDSRYITEAVLQQATSDGQRFSAAATVLVIGGSGYSDIQLGDHFAAAGSLQATDPGERSVALLYANGQPEVEAADGWYGETARIRRTFSAVAAEHAGLTGRDAAGLLPGMVLGDRSTLDDALETAMKNTGLTHITAVSGANCGYLLAFVFLMARAVRLPRGWAAAAGVAALLGFVLVVRPDASVLRAAVMGSLGTIAVLSGRGKLPAALLCLSITVLLAVDPWLSGSYAFILSVLATSGLILLGPRLTELLARRLPWPLAAALAVPMAAQFFCSPVLVLLQPQVPAFSLPANVAVAPVVPLVTVVGMLAAVVAATVPVAAGPFVLISGAGAAWTAGVARFFDGLPGSLVPWSTGVAGVILMVLAAGTGVWLLWRFGPSPESMQPARSASARSAPARSAPVRTSRHLALAAALLLLPAGAAAVWTQLRPGPAPTGWMAAACDVGQGDGLVVRTAAHRAVVIDAGPDPDSMDNCLKRLQVETVDLFILSHAHLDHYGGAEGVLRGREVNHVAYSTAEADLPGPLRTLLADSGAELTRMAEGMTSQAGAVEWEVLWPPARGRQASENDASSVILMTVGPTVEPGRDVPDRPGFTMLLTGDIEEDASGALLSRHAWLRDAGVDVLKVPHHGARNGGTGLIEELNPRLALISVGADNEYGHPAAEILEVLQRSGTAVVRTDELGSISLETDGSSLTWDRLDGR